MRYKAIWEYNQSCQKRGQEKTRCEADNYADFAKGLCAVYGLEIGDDFSCLIFKNIQGLENSYGEAIPEEIEDLTTFPIIMFSSNYGDEILYNPTNSEIINKIQNDSYGDYNLKITGI